jgi:hypothetical protein
VVNSLFLIFDFLNLPILYTVSLDEVIEVEKKYFETLREYWRDHNYLTFNWWLLVLLSILSPIVWWKTIDTKRITEITAFGLFYGVTAIILDSIGSSMLVWVYPVRLTPYLYPQYYPYDVGVVIVPFMYVYQRWGNSIKSFLIATGLLSAFLAFVAEPIMEWLGIYKELKWENIYSFPIYWLIGLICWVIIKRFKKLESKS